MSDTNNSPGKIIERDGVLGLVEAVIGKLGRIIWTAYYRFRFKQLGSGSVVTGKITLLGAKYISIGSNVVIEAGATLNCQSSGKICIADKVHIAKNVEIKSEGELQIREGCCIWSRAEISCVKNMTLEPHTWVARDCKLEGAQIEVGEGVIFGPGVYLITGDHAYNNQKQKFERHGAGNDRPIVIEAGTWIGAKAMILKGVRIGKGSLIGAGAVVTKGIPAGQCAVGVPAAPTKALI